MIYDIKDIPDRLRKFFVSAPEIGLEATPEEFVATMVDVFREVRRVLRKDGVLWLNLGDSYAHNGPCGGSSPDGERKARATDAKKQRAMKYRVPTGLKPKDLCGIPWRVAFALQADGWWLRQDIIWAKPNPMPESVTDRCTKSHEYVFLMTKSAKYHFDADAIKEPAVKGSAMAGNRNYRTYANNGRVDEGQTEQTIEDGRNRRSVWTIASQPYAGAHFATFPEALVEPCILAGTSAHGVCSACGVPWTRVVERTQLKRERPRDFVKRNGKAGTGNSCANSVAGVEVKTLGWEPNCDCGADVVPATVLDPFVGSGTSCVVALANGRRSIGIDLSLDYLEKIAVPRIEGAILSRPSLMSLIPRAVEKTEIGESLEFE